MWILFSFASAFFAGITAILAKIGIKNTDSNVATAIRTSIILLFSWIIVLFVGSFDSISFISYKTILFLILSGFATGGSWICYFKALQLGDVNKVAPIDKSSIILTMLMAFTILGESITMIKLIGMIAIGSGTYLMITKKANRLKNQVPSNNSNWQWMLYAILSAIFASLTSILGKIGIVGIESNLGTAIRTIVVFFMAWLIVFITKKQSEIKSIDRKNLLFISLSGITTGLSWLSYYKALQCGQASIVVPIDKLSILITITFSYFVLKEKLSRKAFLGLVIMVVGTLILLL